jgi:uncharacterized protein
MENREHRHNHKTEVFPDHSERHPKGYYGPNSASAVNLKVRGTSEGENPVELWFDASLLDYPEFHGRGRLVGTISKNADRLTLKGEVSAEGDFDCTRCLEVFQKEISAEVEIQFLPMRLEPNEGDPNVHTYDPVAASTVDILPDLRDALILAIPMKNLCRPDCKGLCQVCGKDRNKELCLCEAPAEASGQWTALKGLSERLRADEI